MITKSPDPALENGIPILITSAIGEKHIGLRMACRQTWIAGLRPEFRPFFVVGSPNQEEAWRFEGDLLRVRCSDGYDHLPEKVRLAMCAVMERFDFPWLFKCDDDSWINPWLFNGYPFWQWDQVGHFAWGEEGWASGAGYSLSRRAAHHVIYEMTCGITGPEDKIVGHLVRDMPGSRRYHEKSILPFSGETWEPCLVGHWIKSPDAMQSFHAQAAAHAGQEQNAGGGLNSIIKVEAPPPVPKRIPGRPKAFPGGNGCIFIQIASYRDADLINTLRDLVSKASDPDRLRFGLCWQRSPEDSLEEFHGDARFKVVDAPWQKSQGLGWARRITQYLYNDEEFTVQLDAHERFVEGWDERLIGMMIEVESTKPILTTYPAGFTPGEPLKVPEKLSKIVARHFREDGGLATSGALFDHADSQMSQPLPARFLAGGFMFTLGQHCREVLHDPHIYFNDELPMAVRSFSHGYDFFHPHEHLAWHFYGRVDQLKHWNDHSKDAKTDGQVLDSWMERERRSRLRTQQLLGQVNHRLPMGEYGLGKVRTLEEYERFAGLDFKERRLHTATTEGSPPPVAMTDTLVWKHSMKTRVGA